MATITYPIQAVEPISGFPAADYTNLGVELPLAGGVTDPFPGGNFAAVASNAVNKVANDQARAALHYLSNSPIDSKGFTQQAGATLNVGGNQLARVSPIPTGARFRVTLSGSYTQAALNALVGTNRPINLDTATGYAVVGGTAATNNVARIVGIDLQPHGGSSAGGFNVPGPTDTVVNPRVIIEL